MAAPLDLGRIYRARRAIAPWVRRTPLVRSASLSRLAGAGAGVHLKLESAHETGAFKIRGATNRLAQLGEDELRRGVVTVSTGNHGRAVALAARRRGVRAVVCLSELVPAHKRAAIEALGAELRIAGRSQDEAEAEAERLAREAGLVPVHPFDDPAVIAGQGTIGIELLEDLGRVDALISGLSGGGLIGGTALALKAANPATRVVAVSMERGPAMFRSVRAGRPVAVSEEPTLADSLGGGIGLANRHTFDLVRRVVDEYVLVSEEEIAAGMAHLYRHERLVAEGGAAVGAAALLAGRITGLEGNVACLVSGNNVDMDLFTRIVSGAWPARDGA